MVSLGHFIFDDIDDSLPSMVLTDFKSRTALFSSAVGDSGHFNLRLCATLKMVYNAEESTRTARSFNASRSDWNIILSWRD